MRRRHTAPPRPGWRHRPRSVSPAPPWRHSARRKSDRLVGWSQAGPPPTILRVDIHEIYRPTNPKAGRPTDRPSRPNQRPQPKRNAIGDTVRWGSTWSGPRRPRTALAPWSDSTRQGACGTSGAGGQRWTAHAGRPRLTAVAADQYVDTAVDTSTRGRTENRAAPNRHPDTRDGGTGCRRGCRRAEAPSRSPMGRAERPSRVPSRPGTGMRLMSAALGPASRGAALRGHCLYLGGTVRARTAPHYRYCTWTKQRKSLRGDAHTYVAVVVLSESWRLNEWTRARHADGMNR